MVATSIGLSPQSLAELEALRVRAPRVYRRALGFASSVAARKLRADIRKGGGLDGIPKFEQKSALTRRLHGKGNWFGKLGKGKVISSWRVGNAQKVGWVDGVAGWVEPIQEKASHPVTKSQRRFMYIKGIPHGEAPSFYERPARRVIDPYAAYLGGGVFAKWVAGAAQNIMNGMSPTGRRSKK